MQARKPLRDPRRHVPLVGDIARQHHIPAAILAHQIAGQKGHEDAIGAGIEADGRKREAVDVAGVYPGRPGKRRRDGDKAGAGGEIEHMLAAHETGMVEHIAGERLSASPGEGPEGRRQPDGAEFVLGLLPQGGCLVGEMEADFRRLRRRHPPRMSQDEIHPIHQIAPERGERNRIGPFPGVRQQLFTALPRIVKACWTHDLTTRALSSH